MGETSNPITPVDKFSNKGKELEELGGGENPLVIAGYTGGAIGAVGVGLAAYCK